ncbi:MAG: glutamate--tRNA ligase family protein [Bacteroidota bacterium]
MASDPLPVISRIAPTPSGYLHLGNLYNFVLTWLHVKMRNGRLLLRIDDLDQARVRDQYLDDIFKTLEWLDIDVDQGPSGTDDFKKNHSQTLRVDDYKKTVDRLRQNSKTFYCNCSRKDLERLSPYRLYQGTCLNKNLAFSFAQTALRIATNEQSVISIQEPDGTSEPVSIHRLMPYAVLVKKDGVPSYQVASLTDDINAGVNFLVRGKDLWTSSLTQTYLAQVAKLETFQTIRFIHHDLIQGRDEQKLSKSQGATGYDKTSTNKTKLLSMVATSFGVESQPEKLSELLEAVKESGYKFQ